MAYAEREGREARCLAERVEGRPEGSDVTDPVDAAHTSVGRPPRPPTTRRAHHAADTPVDGPRRMAPPAGVDQASTRTDSVNHQAATNRLGTITIHGRVAPAARRR